jgi:hypothetical protein
VAAYEDEQDHAGEIEYQDNEADASELKIACHVGFNVEPSKGNIRELRIDADS